MTEGRKDNMDKRKLAVPAAFALGVASIGLIVSAGAASATPGDVHKAWVCKYVGTPGEDERLKEGKNPITVDTAATAGTWFNDAQGRSYVLELQTEANTGQGNSYSGTLVCPVPEGPTESPTPTPTITVGSPSPTPTETTESPSPTPTPTDTGSTPTDAETTTSAPAPIPSSTPDELAGTGGNGWLGTLGALLLAAGAALAWFTRKPATAKH
jgi:cell division septation protein DedD